MKQTKLLLSVLMAIVMMAMSPTKAWAAPMPYVASVTTSSGTEQYTDFVAAVADAMEATEATVTLLANFDLLGDYITFGKGNVTLDLNGKTLAAQSSYVTYVNGGSLTITDNSEGTPGRIECASGPVTINSGSLTIHAGTFSSRYGSALSIVSSTGVAVSIDGGQYITSHEFASAISTNGVSLLAPGYAYYITGTETQIVASNIGNSSYKNVIVKEAGESPEVTDAVSVTIGETTTGYVDFATALTAAEAAESATIKLLQNVDISFTTFDTGNITLDLNGKTIKNPNGSAMYINGASLAIIDTSVEQTGKVQSSGGYFSTTISAYSGSLTIYAGTFDSSSIATLSVGKAYGSDVMPNVKLYGGHFISTSYAIYTEDPNILASGKAFYDEYDNILTNIDEYGYLLGTDGYSALNVTVKDAPKSVANVTIGSSTTEYTDFAAAVTDALDAESATIKMLEDVTLVNGSAPFSLSMDKGNVTLDLNGHKIASQGPNTLNLSNGELTIMDSSGDNSGTMSNTASYALNVTGGNLTIHGGTFSSSYYALNITSTSVTAIIDGGIFKATGGSGINNESGKSILADGYAFCNSDGDELGENVNGYIKENSFPAHYITVKQATPKATLTINGETTDYFDFMTAYNAAINSTSPVTMKLLADANLTAINSGNSLQMTNDGNVTIDLNSHKIYFSASGGYVWVLNGGSLTIDDSSEGKTGTIETNHNSVFFHVNGTLTIHEGKFVSTSSYALDTSYGSPDRVISIDGGRFIGASTAILSDKDVLPDGYSYFNAENGMKLGTKSSTSEDGQSIKDIIVRANATVINDGAFTCPVSYTPESVTFTRSIVKDGGKCSFVVPFDIPADKAAELGKFYEFEKYEDGVIYFAEVTDGVEANKAYFLDPASDVTSITLENVEIKATTDMADATTPSAPGLYGTYKQIDAPEGAYEYASDDANFVLAVADSKVEPFRAYLWLGDSAEPMADAVFGSGPATAINASRAESLDTPVYNLSGQRIASPHKGEIYIMSGKKVMFK